MSSRVVIFTVGTEGDARPYVALAQGLARHGHQAVIATSREFEPFVRGHGLDFSPITADFSELMARNKTVMDRRSQLAMLRALMSETRRMAHTWAEEGMAAASNADLVIGSGNVSLLAASVAERLGVPLVRSQLQPFDPNRDLPPPLFRPLPFRLPGSLNMALYRVLRVLAWRLMRGPVDEVRAGLDLPAYPPGGPWALPHAAGGRILYGFSRHVVPRQPEWPARIAMPGYFILDQADRYQPSAALAGFLQAGPKPIYVGFGSMVTSRAVELARLVAAAVSRSGRRAVISSGWAGLAAHLPRSDNILAVSGVPHEWLFPKVALAVHHCGAGTTAAAVRAGIPTVPVPFVGDQFFWAWQLGRLGVATDRLERRSLTPGRLAAEIVQAGTRKGLRLTFEDPADARQGAGAGRARPVLERGRGGDPATGRLGPAEAPRDAPRDV